MTVELIDLPNPPPMASKLPSETLKLAKDLAKQKLDPETAESLRAFRSAADYIAAGTRTLRSSLLHFVDQGHSNDIPEGQCVARAQVGR
jgi:hypothetical protein